MFRSCCDASDVTHGNNKSLLVQRKPRSVLRRGCHGSMIGTCPLNARVQRWGRETCVPPIFTIHSMMTARCCGTYELLVVDQGSIPVITLHSSLTSDRFYR
ncbi:hypothetical protein RvY_03822 [Ramazzottius varieornatus]|uniref:Uncharacterized protein n=1 Tax=Ramazzottius varieornatus TaxID=947166 RepID=A0A1D1UWH4_RAMVA|nr:hypothetical protein RvY_03822 [Ramazzottius varieornatus]